MFTKILVGLDGSPGSLRAMEIATRALDRRADRTSDGMAVAHTPGGDVQLRLELRAGTSHQTVMRTFPRATIGDMNWTHEASFPCCPHRSIAAGTSARSCAFPLRDRN